MVDLVKVRQKAKKRGAAAGVSPAGRERLDKFLAEAGKKRDTVAPVVETAIDHLELLTFIIGRERYSIEIDSIAAIVMPQPPTRVPNADAAVIGIMSLRGTIVTMIDVRRRLRQTASDRRADCRIIVVRHGADILGFEVDRVLRVVEVDRATIESPPTIDDTEDDEAIRGVFRQGDALTIVLDVDVILSRENHER
jgi:purine-binding chemotaxis protein CheW